MIIYVVILELGLFLCLLKIWNDIYEKFNFDFDFCSCWFEYDGF